MLNIDVGIEINLLNYLRIYRRNWHIRPGLIIESAPQLTNQTWSYTTGGSYKLVGQ
jgi:hypothetical protein